MNLDCDIVALEAERQNLAQYFTTINNAMSSFIKVSKDVCKADVWSGEAENAYYGLIDGIVENFAAVSDHFVNINLYLSTVISNYAAVERKINSSIGSIIK